MRFFTLFSACLLLAACAPTLNQPVAPYNVSGGPVMLYDVDGVEIVNMDSASAAGDDYIIDPPPAVAVEQLLRRNLVAQGGTKILRAIIEDASIRTERLSVTEGIKGKFYTEPSARYNAHMMVRFELADAMTPDIVTGRAEINVNRSTNIMENATLAEKDLAAQNLVTEVTNDVARGLEDVVRKTFGGQR